MEGGQVIAAFIAGIVAPFVQEIIFGAKVSGRAAAALAAVIAFVIATFATWVSGGFANATSGPAFNLIDPSAFFSFWVFEVFAPVYGIGQLVYSITTQRKPEGVTTGPVQSVGEKVQPVIGTN